MLECNIWLRVGHKRWHHLKWPPEDRLLHNLRRRQQAHDQGACYQGTCTRWESCGSLICFCFTVLSLSYLGVQRTSTSSIHPDHAARVSAGQTSFLGDLTESHEDMQRGPERLPSPTAAHICMLFCKHYVAESCVMRGAPRMKNRSDDKGSSPVTTNCARATATAASVQAWLRYALLPTIWSASAAPARTCRRAVRCHHLTKHL